MIKNVYVTGATGQDGHWMIRHILRETPHNVVALKRRTVGEVKTLDAFLDSPRFSIQEFDITDYVSVDKIFSGERKVDYFVNFAANSFVGSSWDIPKLHQEVNFLGVLNILEAIRKYQPNCRFYNAGSSEEWGDVIYSPQDEYHPLRPRSPYGVSKCAARLMTKVYRESYNIYAIQGFLLNHESEIRGKEFVTRKITKFIGNLRKNKGILELGNLDSSRDWSHAEDFVDGIWRMLNQPEIRGFDAGNTSLLKEYVLSSNETHTVREFLTLALNHAGIKHSFVGNGVNEVVVSDDYSVICKVNEKFYRPAEVDLLHGDSSLARKELGWNPKNSFKDLVCRMVENDQ